MRVNQDLTTHDPDSPSVLIFFLFMICSYFLNLSPHNLLRLVLLIKQLFFHALTIIIERMKQLRFFQNNIQKYLLLRQGYPQQTVFGSDLEVHVCFPVAHWGFQEAGSFFQNFFYDPDAVFQCRGCV